MADHRRRQPYVVVAYMPRGLRHLPMDYREVYRREPLFLLMGLATFNLYMVSVSRPDVFRLHEVVGARDERITGRQLPAVDPYLVYDDNVPASAEEALRAAFREMPEYESCLFTCLPVYVANRPVVVQAFPGIGSRRARVLVEAQKRFHCSTGYGGLSELAAAVYRYLSTGRRLIATLGKRIVARVGLEMVKVFRDYYYFRPTPRQTRLALKRYREPPRWYRTGAKCIDRMRRLGMYEDLL